MGAVTDCAPETLGAHVARLEDLQEIFRHEVTHDFKETAEATLNETPHRPYTLADYLFCLNYTGHNTGHRHF